MTLQISSPAFGDNGTIPAKHTCEGQEVAPALSWSGLPKGTKTLALIVDDPDAPDPAAPLRTYVHWVAFNLPATSAGLPEGGALPAGASSGLNDWKREGYGGPCPPMGRHRYFFKLYALDLELRLVQPTKAQLEAAMEGHVLAKAELVGTYQKAKAR
jgi:Raf kinase inhibitor-like YbhB/YbcL family protein